MAAIRIKIKLVSTAKQEDGRATGTYYVITKNKREHPEKMEVRKFDRRAYNPETKKTGMHAMFKEVSKLK